MHFRWKLYQFGDWVLQFSEFRSLQCVTWQICLYLSILIASPLNAQVGLSAYRDRRFDGNQEQYEARLKASTTVYVGNLSFFTTEEQILELFSRVGDVRRVVMGLDKQRLTPCGFCFVEYYSRLDCEACVNMLGGSVLDERPIRVDIDWGFQDGRQYGRGKSGGQVWIRPDFGCSHIKCMRGVFGCDVIVRLSLWAELCQAWTFFRFYQGISAHTCRTRVENYVLGHDPCPPGGKPCCLSRVMSRKSILRSLMVSPVDLVTPVRKRTLHHLHHIAVGESCSVSSACWIIPEDCLSMLARQSPASWKQQS